MKTLHIKNMVCNHCIRVVKEELINLGHLIISIELGKVELVEKLNDENLNVIGNVLEKAAKKALNTLDKVNMSLLKGNAHNQWMESMKIIKDNLNGIVGMKGIEMKRSHFSIVSNELTNAIEVFGIAGGKTAYLVYCPMAFNDKGAYWISAEKEIRNPYFGDMMLKCGEVKRTIGN